VACGKSLKTTQNKATKYSSKIDNFLFTPKVPKLSVDQQKLSTLKDRVESYKFSVFPK
jgi:hypothetical protein